MKIMAKEARDEHVDIPSMQTDKLKPPPRSPLVERSPRKRNGRKSFGNDVPKHPISNMANSNSDHREPSRLKVCVRLRPMNEAEKEHGTLPVIKASTQNKTVTVIKNQASRQVRSSFTVDNVFTAFSTQEEVFDETLKPIIRDVMNGYESTVFAYGQT